MGSLFFSLSIDGIAVFTMKVSFIVSLAFFLFSNVSANKKLLKQIVSLVKDNRDLILEKCGYNGSGPEAAVNVFVPGFFYMDNLFGADITWGVTYSGTVNPGLCPTYDNIDQGAGTKAYNMNSSCVLTDVLISVAGATCNVSPDPLTGSERRCQVNN